MDDVRLANYLAGTDAGPIEAGRVRGVTARHLRVPDGTPIWLSDYTLTKTRFRHPEIVFQDYLMLPRILDSGFVVAGNRSRTIATVYIDTGGTKYRLWTTALKSTGDDRVFLTMFHPYRMKEARRIYRRAQRRGILLRDHEGQLARRLLQRARGV